MSENREPGMIGHDAFNELLRICREALPLEACGVLARSEHAAAPDMVIPVRNAHNRPADSFAFDPEEWTAVFFAMQKNRQSLVGLYHSHPSQDAVPSVRDRAGFLPASGVTYWIVSLPPGQPPRVQPYTVSGGALKPVDLVLA